jgi:hypothetical protein
MTWGLFIAHLIGDYILQNDWMAQNKKKHSLHCAIHVATYMLPFLFCGLDWWQLLAIAVQHYVLDRTMFVGWFMEFKGSKQFRDGALAPWSWVVMDNILHILWIALVVWVGTIL